MLREMMNQGGTDMLAEVHAEPEAVTLYSPREAKFTAIVRKLRIESQVVVTSSEERTVYNEQCEVVIYGPGPFQISPRDPVLVAKYTTGDASVSQGQRFSVLTVLAVRSDSVTVLLTRPRTAGSQRQGFEGA